MAYANVAKNNGMTAIAAAADQVSLHSGDPGTTGENEVTASGRVATVWGAASAGEVVGSQTEHSVASGVTVSHFGVWSSGGAGVFHAGAPMRDAQGAPTSETFSSDGLFRFTPTLRAVDVA